MEVNIPYIEHLGFFVCIGCYFSPRMQSWDSWRLYPRDPPSLKCRNPAAGCCVGGRGFKSAQLLIEDFLLRLLFCLDKNDMYVYTYPPWNKHCSPPRHFSLFTGWDVLVLWRVSGGFQTFWILSRLYNNFGEMIQFGDHLLHPGWWIPSLLGGKFSGKSKMMKYILNLDMLTIVNIEMR